MLLKLRPATSFLGSPICYQLRMELLADLTEVNKLAEKFKTLREIFPPLDKNTSAQITISNNKGQSLTFEASGIDLQW